jgi:hypothetical protein
LQIPEFPKVGFWTIRVAAQGQIEEKRVSTEYFYSLPPHALCQDKTFSDNLITKKAFLAVIIEGHPLA